MGGSQSTIVNSVGYTPQTSEIKVDNVCDRVKCSPNDNISTFCNYDNNINNNINSKLIYIILLLFSMFLFVFIWKLKK